MPLAEVLRVTTRLDAAEARYWLGGGWGLDSLLGFQSRIHHDLDLILSDYDESLPGVRDALQAVGYRTISTDRAGAWLPRRTTFLNGHDQIIEVLGVDWDMVDAAWKMLKGGDFLAETKEARRRFFATGSLLDRPIPVLSREAQALFHTGYRHKPKDERNIERLHASAPDRGDVSSVAASGRTALLVPVFGLGDHALRIWSEQADSNPGLPPHVTVLYPFLSGEKLGREALDRVRAICAATPRFAFELVETGWFDDRVLFLAPRPAEPFMSLTGDITEAFPEFPPYQGAFETTIPHLTVGEKGTSAALRRAEVRIRRFLPVTAKATHVWLMTCAGPGEEWTLAEFFPLGSTAESASTIRAGASSQFAREAEL